MLLTRSAFSPFSDILSGSSHYVGFRQRFFQDVFKFVSTSSRLRVLENFVASVFSGSCQLLELSRKFPA